VARLTVIVAGPRLRLPVGVRVAEVEGELDAEGRGALRLTLEGEAGELEEALRRLEAEVEAEGGVVIREVGAGG